MAAATQTLADSETGSKKQAKATKSLPSSTRYPAGTEWELLQTDATILHALTLALKYVVVRFSTLLMNPYAMFSESYMGYLQCLYELNRYEVSLCRPDSS